jgi:hypothetical protein
MCNSGWAGFFSGLMQISGSTCYFRDVRRGLARSAGIQFGFSAQ